MMLIAALALAALAPAGEARAWEPALRAAERDLCSKRVALLGENGFHGDGKTVAFKAELVRRLVGRCGYRAVFFEASHYDFLAIERAARRGERVSEAMVSSAIGGLWNRDAEIAPLIAFLTARAATGKVALGGLDDQLGSVGAFYSLEAMPADLMAGLPPARAAACTERLRQRLNWTYSPASPHDAASVASLRSCATEAEAAWRADRARAPVTQSERLQMLANVRRALSRDFLDGKALVAGRDRSMYLNFRWLAARLPKGAKIVLWSENAHVAKDAGLAQDFASGGNLGFYLHRDYGPRIFLLGFAAASGSFRWGPRGSMPVAPAAAGSVEDLVVKEGGGEAGYAGRARLSRFGVATAALFDHRKPLRARWADAFDGVVVFRAERPPRRTDE